MTGQQCIDRVLRELGVLGSGQVSGGDQAADALVVLKRMINRWAAERLTIYSLLRTVKALTSGTRDYTIGPGGAINIAWPEWIESAAVVLDSTAATPIELGIAVYTEQEWNAIAAKTLQAGAITGVFYDHAFSSTQRGTLSTYPTINVANTQLVLYTPLATVGYTDLVTDLIFPPAYEEAIHYNLLRRLARENGRPVTEDMKDDARESLAIIKRANLRLVEMGSDAAALFGHPGVSNIYTGS